MKRHIRQFSTGVACDPVYAEFFSHKISHMSVYFNNVIVRHKTLVAICRDCVLLFLQYIFICLTAYGLVIHNIYSTMGNFSTQKNFTDL